MRHGSRIVRGFSWQAQAATLFFAFALSAAAAAPAGVIPIPAEVVPGIGSFEVGTGTVVQVPRGDGAARAAARYLVELWTRTNGLKLPITSAAANGGDAGTPTHAIAFRRRSGLGPEGYELDVAAQQITVSASTAAGLFYGAVSLWQLLPPGPATGRIPAQRINDSPAYAWRGLMLDSARHFQSPAFIHSMIDWMAWHKLNVLHWHLTDDQGWRLEIRGKPTRGVDLGRRMAHRAQRRALWRLLYSRRGARHRPLRGGPPCANRPGDRHAGPCDGGDRRLP